MGRNGHVGRVEICYGRVEERRQEEDAARRHRQEKRTERQIRFFLLDYIIANKVVLVQGSAENL